MSDFSLRLALAALLSASGWFLTTLWSKQNQIHIVTEDPAAIARIASLDHEVMRRPAQHLVWKSVNRSEELFDGEAVRTTSNAEAQIEFIDQQVTVNLEPDSVLEISRSNGKLNLAFLKGNLSIKAGANSDVTLKSGDRTIALAPAPNSQVPSEIQVSKGAGDAPMEVQSTKGDVREMVHGKAEPVALPKLRILNPHSEEVVYIDRTGGTDAPTSADTHIDFSPLEESYLVTVKTGETATELTDLEGSPSVTGSTGEIHPKLTPGTHFLRLVAKGPEGKEVKSPIIKAVLRTKVAPEPLTPTADAHLHLSEKMELNFAWSNPAKLHDLRLEVAESPRMKPAIAALELGDSTTQNVAIPGTARKLYWRVIGRVPRSNEALISAVRTVVVVPETPDPLAPPELTEPASPLRLSLLSMRTQGLHLAWKPVENANRYEVNILLSGSTTPFKFTSPIPSGTIEKLKSGTYSWFVVAEDETGQASPPSSTRVFSVEDVPQLQWADHKVTDTQVFKGAKPLMRLSWERGPGAPQRFRLHWRARGRVPAAATEPAEKELNATNFEIALPSDGIYEAEVESLDGAGEVLARSAPRVVDFKPTPPPPAPEFTRGTPSELLADDKGNVDVSWSPVSEAKEYEVQLLDTDGEVIKTERKPATQATYQELKPGEYNIVVRSIDHLGRLGPPGEPQVLKVPEWSSVRAPKIKSILVK